MLLILVIPSSTTSSFKGFYFRFGIKVVATGMLTLLIVNCPEAQVANFTACGTGIDCTTFSGEGTGSKR